MNFDDFINQAWNDHAVDSNLVAERIDEGMRLISESSQIPQIAGLITHIFGEHLGQWQRGIQKLERLKQLPQCNGSEEAESSIMRSVASLKLASGDAQATDGLKFSDQIRVLATTSTAICEQGDTRRAAELLDSAITLANTVTSKDPAIRALAVSANNLASTLETRALRTSIETDLMVQAAQVARKFWEIAGTWLQVERAEYRLAQTYLSAQMPEQALQHAKNCVAICNGNNAPPLEFFFGYEALALAEKNCGHFADFKRSLELAKSNFDKLSEADKAWCGDTLTKLLSTSDRS